MSKSEILRPFNLPRDIFQSRTVLVISSEGCLDIPDDLKTFTEGSNNRLNVHYSKGLPLPCGDKHPPFDLVVLVCKVFNKASLDTVKETASFLDVRYLAGKCFVLVFSDSNYDLGVDTREIEDFADSLSLPVHYSTKRKDDKTSTNKKPSLQLPSGLLSIYCPPVGCDVNSYVIDAFMSHKTSQEI